MGQLNSWKDATLANYDGMMSAKAKAGTSHSAGVMKWKAKTTGTAYFALKVGTNKTSFSYSFDNFILKDLTAEAETSIDQVQADEDSNAHDALGKPNRIYNLSGLTMSERPKQSGIYIITDGKHTQKVLTKK